MTRRSRAVVTFALAAALAGAGIGIWLALDRLDGRATWLTVEAPARAVAGQPYPMRITIREAPAPTYLMVDLHWSDKQHVARGYLVKGAQERILEPQGSWSIAASIDRRPDLGFITAVIHLTPTGEWKDRVRVARTGSIAVTDRGDPNAKLRWIELPAYEESPAVPDSATALGRIALASLLAAYALAGAWAALRSQQRPVWIVLCLAALTAAICELSGAGGAATQLGRSLAEARHWYALRKPLQKALVAVLGTGGLVLAIAAPRIGRSLGRGLRLSVLATILYWLLAAVELLSFHAVDTLTHRGVGPVSLMQALKAACVALALLAAAWPLARGMISRRRHP